MVLFSFCSILMNYVENSGKKLKFGKFYHFNLLKFGYFFAILPLAFSADFVVK